MNGSDLGCAAAGRYYSVMYWSSPGRRVRCRADFLLAKTSPDRITASLSMSPSAFRNYCIVYVANCDLSDLGTGSVSEDIPCIQQTQSATEDVRKLLQLGDFIAALQLRRSNHALYFSLSSGFSLCQFVIYHLQQRRNRQDLIEL